jgi:glycosyltransferase involved in cell wall biosynthesis
MAESDGLDRATRILFLNPSGSLGGAERCLLDLMASFRRHAAAGALELGLVVGGDGPLIGAAQNLGVRVFDLPLSDRLAAVGDSGLAMHGPSAIADFGRRLAKAVVDAPLYGQKLRAIIRGFSPAVVHSNGIKMHLFAAAVGTPAPLVWHLRDFIGARPVVSRAMRLLAGRAHAAIGISNAVANDARRVLPGLPVSVVHDAIDTEAFRPEGPTANLDALAKSEPPPAGTLRVGFVATYARWKGHEAFLRAAQIVRSMRHVSPARFYVVGGPIYSTAASQYRAEELRALVRDLGIEDVVTFVPFQDRIEDVYRALDVVVHASSRPEPFGRTIAEAMATGKPLIASRESGAAELFVEGVDAVAADARDPRALAQALRALLTDPTRRSALGRAARLAAVERFSRGRLAKETLGVYRTLGCDPVLSTAPGRLVVGHPDERTATH